MADDEDRQYFADVCYSLMAYADDAALELQSLEETFQNVKDPLDRALLPSGCGYEKLFAEMKVAARINAHFLAGLVTSDEDAREYAQIPKTHQVQESNSMKTRTVLRQFVRDWAVEGQKERDSQYGVLLKALLQHMPLPPGCPSPHVEPPHVLCPGSGLSRLPFEVARLGYCAQGNEFSYHMLQGSKWVLNETTSPKSHTIFPFVLRLEHRKNFKSHLQPIKIPDLCPALELNPARVAARPQDFSMSAGEFVEVYAPQEQEWDAVLTCFFLDTANNVFLYIRTIARILRPGGLWANFGPLLYHYAESPGAVSIELSWEEVKPSIEKYFDFKEEEVRQECHYTTNEDGLFHTAYRCIFFSAIRNNTPPQGYSKPVFKS